MIMTAHEQIGNPVYLDVNQEKNMAYNQWQWFFLLVYTVQ